MSIPSIKELTTAAQKLFKDTHSTIDSKLFIPDLMKRVHMNTEGSLALRMISEFVPLQEFRPVPKRKPKPVWYGDKIAKAKAKGRMAGTNIEGIVGGAIREMKRERMVSKIKYEYLV